MRRVPACFALGLAGCLAENPAFDEAMSAGGTSTAVVPTSTGEDPVTPITGEEVVATGSSTGDASSGAATTGAVEATTDDDTGAALACGDDGDCPGGQFCRGVCRALAGSCAGYLAQGLAEDGVYPLDPEGDGTRFDAHCLMSVEEGGWTLALKVDGAASTFVYVSPLWEDAEVLAPEAPDFDRTEAKLASYATVAMSEVLLGLATGEGEKPKPAYLRLPAPAAQGSLRDLLAPDVHVATELPRERWLDLVNGAMLQPGCARQGFDVRPDYDEPVDPMEVVYGWAKVRIGVIANYEAECDTPDSVIGVGVMNHCFDYTLSAGNESCFNPLESDGKQKKPAFAWVWVR